MDPLFPPGGLDDLRAISRATMTEPCDIVREAGAAGSSGDEVEPTDDMGNPVNGPNNAVDNNPDPETTSTWCRIGGGPKTEEERLVAGRMTGVDLVVVALPLGTDVKEGDTLLVRGLELEVKWVPDPVPTNAVDLRVLAHRER